ncbi:MAG: hypothetical protein JWO91_2169 [Acidobacteriaceae bacterium]|jgi:hypothetical protein|nr:hypothetical protein [Acidobacteriaceae bacterium]
MPQLSSSSLDPDVSDALWAALSSIRHAKSMTTAYGKNYSRLQKITDELKDLLGETEATAPIVRV